jgi:hypothetical protein
MWDLWWAKWHWGRFSPSISLSPVNLYSTDCSINIIIYHLGLVQLGKQWLQHEVDSISPHEKIIIIKRNSVKSTGVVIKCNAKAFRDMQ